MKIHFMLMAATALLPVFTLAQQQAYDPEMMQQMAEMQNCLMQIDYQEIAVMEQRSAELESQINALCAAGNETAAKNLAIEFSDQVMSSKTMQAMQQCVAGMPGMQDQLKVPDFRQELQRQSICDIVKKP